MLLKLDKRDNIMYVTTIKTARLLSLISFKALLNEDMLSKEELTDVKYKLHNEKSHILT